ncbi:hypothetical protein GGI03_003826 [Coemansia sp. RSA 2337]|nr:hypothetical protein GGH13_002017 [Coemansia sp. S155-1]KAJ2110908.1 hypothetical protein IW146_005705 [Coemansia sp. RSA 922]KAJ2463461.1 hypothetical protein GGI03_003826 [Coemansia sp. RSA 2337]
MDSSLLKLQNTEVVVGLVGSQSIAQPGDTSKYFTCSATSSPERVYVDGCTADVGNLFTAGNIQNYVKHAVSGGTSALFLAGSGITRMGDYDRKRFMADFCQSIGRSMARYDPDLSMTYAFVGLTDNKIVDFHRDRNVAPDRLLYGLADLQHEVEDWEQTEEKIMRGSTLPFILSLHFESLKTAPTNGHLCLVDLSIVNWSPTATLSAAPAADGTSSDQHMAASSGTSHGMLQQSTKSLSSLIHLLANDAVLTGATIPNSALLSLVGEFLYGESKTAFVMYLNTDDSATEDMRSAISLIKALRRLKSRELIRPVDRRVMFFYEKAKYYQGEKYRLQDELGDAQEEKEQTEKDLDEIQRDFGDEREALSKEVEHWQGKSQTLEETLATLKSESAGIEADARWENARLVTDKLALRDELRRAEIEMAAAEDAKSKLLDLYENLQGSHASLDAVYEELLAAYRVLKDRYGRLAEDNIEMGHRVEDLDALAAKRQAQTKELKAEMAVIISDRDLRIKELESQHAQAYEALESQLATESQRAKELDARAAQLGADNKALSASQSEAVSGLQATISDLTAKLEDAQRQAASKIAALTSSLRAAERQNKRLDAEKAKLVEKVDELAADTEIQAEHSAQEAQWAKEREQLLRQISRLQQTAANAERREAELREESEAQWTAWETEKSRNHEKYLKLKDRFREAVEYAADVQVRLDDERERIEPVAAPTRPSPIAVVASVEPVAEDDDTPAEPISKAKPKSKAKAKQPPRRKAQPKSVSAPAPAPATSAEPAEESEVDISPVELAPPAPTATRATGRSPPTRRTGGRSKRVQPSYTEPEIDDIDTGGQVNGGGNESDDSEITFNIAPPPAPAPVAVSKSSALKRGGNGTRAPRRKKSVAELSAELHTQPARKRATSRAATAVVGAEVAALSISDTVEEPPVRRPSPKRKQPGVDTTTAFALPVVESSESSEGAVGLKKKRKLNLSRMRSLMGITADRSAAPAASALAVKFAVPRIRAAANAAMPAPLSASSHGAESADSD